MTDDERKRQGLPPDPYAGVPGTTPVQPFQETTRSSSTTVKGPERTEKEKTPEIEQASLDFAASQAAKVAALEQQKQAAAEIERIELENAQKVSEERERFAVQKQQEDERRAAQLQALRAQEATFRESLAKAEGAKNTGYWADKSTPARIVSAIIVGLAEGAHTGSGPSAARQILESKMEEDRQIKLGRLDTARQGVKDAEGMTARGEGEREAALKGIDNQQIVSLQKLADQLEIAKKRFPTKAAQFDQAIAEARGLAAEKVQAQENQFAATVSAPTVSKTSGGSVRTVTGERSPAKEGPDLTVFDTSGGERRARSEPEAKELREGQVALESARQISENLKALAQKKGRLPDTELQGEIDTEVSNLLEKKKGVLGALNEGDIARAKGQFSTGLLRSPEAAGKAIDAFIRGMETAYSEGIRVKSIGGSEPASRRPSQADLEALQWARQNPNDPRAAQIMERVRAKAPKK